MRRRRRARPRGSPDIVISVIVRIAVFCGSSLGDDPLFKDSAEQVGRLLAERSIPVVYGGGHVGLMGVVADAALAAGGDVIGVIPRQLDQRELTHQNLTEIHIVESMHERKTMMAELADAFLALPGGAGTVEEIAEQWTWAHLGIHDKPSGFFDVNGFWQPVRQLRDHMLEAGFINAANGNIITFDDDLERLLDRLGQPAGAAVKWQNDAPRA